VGIAMTVLQNTILLLEAMPTFAYKSLLMVDS
jgi:hypothetical protein